MLRCVLYIYIYVYIYTHMTNRVMFIIYLIVRVVFSFDRIKSIVMDSKLR